MKTELAIRREMRRLEQSPWRSVQSQAFLAGVVTALLWVTQTGAAQPSSCAILTGKKWTREQRRKSRQRLTGAQA